MVSPVAESAKLASALTVQDVSVPSHVTAWQAVPISRHLALAPLRLNVVVSPLG